MYLKQSIRCKVRSEPHIIQTRQATTPIRPASRSVVPTARSAFTPLFCVLPWAVPLPEVALPDPVVGAKAELRALLAEAVPEGVELLGGAAAATFATLLHAAAEFACVLLSW